MFHHHGGGSLCVLDVTDLSKLDLNSYHLLLLTKSKVHLLALKVLLLAPTGVFYSDSVLLYIQQRPLFEILSISANMYVIIDSVYEILSALYCSIMVYDVQ